MARGDEEHLAKLLALVDSLRSPLHATSGLVDMLGETAADDDRELVTALQGEHARLEALIDELTAQLAAPEPVAEASPGRALVWVVDDSPANRLLTRTQLERLGYQAQTCASGDEALARFEAGERPSMVLLDWHMPGLDGLETATRLREVEAEHALEPMPIVALTARAMPGDRERCLDAGMDDFLSKPISMQDVAGALQKWMSRKRHVDGLTAVGEVVTDSHVTAPADAVDRSVIDHLVGELADPAIVSEVLQTFLDELPERVDSLTESWAAGDLGTVRLAAHTLCSMSRTVGAEVMASLAGNIEANAASGSPRTELDQLVPTIRARAEQVTSALQEVLADLCRDDEVPAAQAGPSADRGAVDANATESGR